MLRIYELFVEDIDDPPLLCVDPPPLCRHECTGIYVNSSGGQMLICPHLALNFEDGQVLKIVENHLTEKSKRIDALEQEIEDLKAQLEDIQHV